MSESQITKLLTYVDAFHAEMNSKLDDTASQVSLDRLTNTIDAFIKRLVEAEQGVSLENL